MADDDDKESKTEEASEKKTREAVERGEKPVSRDVVATLTLFGVFFGLTLLGNLAEPKLRPMLGQILGLGGEMRLSRGSDVVGLAAEIGRICLMAILPFAALVIAAAVIAHIAQGELRFARERLKPQLSRLSPLKGVKRIFGRRGLVEFAKASAKLGLCAFVATLVVRSHAADMLDAMFREPALLGASLGRLTLKLIGAIAAIMACIALVDILHTRFAWRQSLRMTRHEVKEEMKQADGDPLMKARLRSIAMDRARRRMIVDVERATVVIANPTHYAIALRYVREEGGAPMVLATGVDLIALTIRERAEALGIPVVENPPLARSMHAQVEIGQMIPPEFYRAVAEVINYLSRDATAT